MDTSSNKINLEDLDKTNLEQVDNNNREDLAQVLELSNQSPLKEVNKEDLANSKEVIKDKISESKHHLLDSNLILLNKEDLIIHLQNLCLS